jgi:restriction endonuclease S subunit
LEGLEISEIWLSELAMDNHTLRIDSEYLQKKYLQNIENLKKHTNGYSRLNEHIKHLTGGATPLGAEYQDKGIMFLRVQNIMQNYFNLGDVVYISQNQNDEIKRSQLKENDVLLTITGVSYGKSAVVPKNLAGENINQHSVKITLKQTLNPYFLSTFLNSRMGKLQSDKNIVGVTRPALDYQVIKNFVIPNVTISFQNKIELLIKKAQNINEESKTLYTSAENLLLEALGLNNFESKKVETNYNIKSFKDSFLASGRLDAEYWQPKYEIVENLVKSQGYSLVEDICSEVNYGTVPTSLYSEDGSGIPYIKGMNLKQCSVVGELDKITNTSELNKRFYTKEGDIIISQMGTVGDVGVVSKEQENWLFASFTIRIRLKDFSKFQPHFVGLYIQKVAKEYYLLRNIAQASVRQNTDLPTIRNMYIPHIDFDLQTQISLQVQESFRLRAESERLLALAKEAVEVAIEEGEEEAEKLL